MMEVRKSGVLRTIPLLITIFFLSFPGYAKYGGGSGEPNDPYLIYTAEQMNAIGLNLGDRRDKHFKLMEDIDLSAYTGTDFNIIGLIRGVFDGNGHTISNFSYTTTTGPLLGGGLFRNVGGVIKDLGLINPNVDLGTGSHAGSLAYSVSTGTISNCYAEGASVSSYEYAGGLVGYNYRGTITNCTSSGSVSGNDDVGGLVGHNYDGTITDCYTSGSVTGDDDVGGLVGGNAGTISNCYAASSVSGSGTVRLLSGVGGLVGYNYGTISDCSSAGSVSGTVKVGGLVGGNANAYIENCYATGSVSGTTYVGGLVGENWVGTINNCYSIGRVTGTTDVGGLVGLNSGAVTDSFWDTQTSGHLTSAGGTGKTTAEMQIASTFLEAGWDFVGEVENGPNDVWKIVDGLDYPRLWWEKYSGGTGEPNNPYKIATADDLILLGESPEDYDKHFIMIDDIDLDPNLPGRKVFDRAVIAPDTNDVTERFDGTPFTGVFDGNGHIISNLTISGVDYTGLFGYIERGGHVENLRLLNMSVTGNQYVGGLIGYNLGAIHQCSVTGTVEGNSRVGGLVGQNAGPITRCLTNGQITGNQYIGGLVGFNGNSTIQSCFSNCRVVGREYVGGFVGISGNSLGPPAGQAGPPPGSIPYPPTINISSCYSAGHVEGWTRVGGLAGDNRGSIQFSYSTSRVAETGHFLDVQTNVGGLVGTNIYGVVLLSYWDIEGSGQSFSTAGKGKTTEQMMSVNTFSGWGYTGEWVIDEGNDYPHLAWEGLEGKPIVDTPNRYASGAGTPIEPYKIQTSDDLIRLANHPIDWDRYFVLTSDIDFNDVDPNLISPIGVYGMPFTGIFDGNGYTVLNFKCLFDTESYLGLFGSIGPEISDRPYGSMTHDPNNSGSVINLNIENVQVSAYCCAGGLAGYNSGIISNCSVTGNVTAVSKDAGGLLGFNDGEITDCYAQGNITSKQVAGGLIAHNRGPVKACSFKGSVENRSSCSGGLIGYNYNTIESCHFNGDITGVYNTGGLIGLNGSTVINCSASGNVTGTDCVGGLVGHNFGSLLNCYAMGSVNGIKYVAGLTGINDKPITFCYSSCTVIGQQKTGGLVGSRNYLGEVSNSFWDVDISGQIISAEGIGKTTAEMQTANTFLEAGWDFMNETTNGTEDIWWIDEGRDYPRLLWELIPEN